VVVAAVTLHELPSRQTLAGVALIVGGVYLVELDRLRRAGPAVPIPPEAAVWTASLFGLGTALCWAVSPVLIRRGLQDLPSPLLGVTIGLVAATLAYGLALLRPGGRRLEISTWTRWYAVALVPVAVVLGLGLLSVPTVMAAAPLLVGRQAERVTAAVLAGSALVVAGAAVVVTGP
jgi:drug/metabolite transporter (DMT)-like permease